MSNRQARREQSRASRNLRTNQRPRTPSGRPAGGPVPPRRGGDSMMSWLASPFTWIVGVLVLAGVGALALVIALDDGGGATTNKLVEQLEDAEDKFPYDMAKGNKVGSDDAPIKLTQFEDFQCPFCLQYTAEQEPLIIEEYVKTGKVQIIYENLAALGIESTRAARGGECAAEQDKFWQFHNRLFVEQAKAGQRTNERLNVGRFSDENLVKFAKEAGADEKTFEICLEGDGSLRNVQEDNRIASQFGIRATPGFLINNVPFGSGAPSSAEAWRKILDDAIANPPGSAPSPTATASASPGTATATATASPATATATPATATATSSPTAAPTATPTRTP
ncbi:MAG: DsbA family protein [Dehalococcoidia bacterium]